MAIVLGLITKLDPVLICRAEPLDPEACFELDGAIDER